MKAEFLAKIMAFVQEKGGRTIIVDSEKEKAMVVLPFAEYEALLSKGEEPGLTKNEELDRMELEMGSLAEPKESADFPRRQDDWGGNEDLDENTGRYYMEPLE